jgi:Replication initiation factor
MDYLVVCGVVDSVPEIESILGAAFGSVFDWTASTPRTIGVRYDGYAVDALGVMVAWRRVESLGRLAVRVSIPGKPLSHAGFERCRDACRAFLARGFYATRFDWAIDDFDRKLEISRLHESCRDGSMSGARNYTYMSSARVGSRDVGESLYLGSASSDKLVRIYDKKVESRGEIDSIRFEVQWRDKLAQAALLVYCREGASEDAVLELSQKSVGAVRFIERLSEVASRCPLVSWYADFVERVGGIMRHSVSRLQTTITDKMRWVSRSVVKTLALIYSWSGFENAEWWLSQQIRDAIANQSPRNTAYLETIRRRLAVGEMSYDDAATILSWDA